ncbi:MAG: hypothetical protein EXQ94_14130 [Alphaproteobacteria bacterium]|nr:hypothetical protein [Alphaproteobacteria bacterium]
MIDTLLIDRTPRQTRIALLAGGRTIEVWSEQPNDPLPRCGDVYLCRVTGRADAMGGVFVTLGGDEAAFLRDPTLHDGERVVAQVIVEAQGGKGPRLTRRVALPGRAAVLEPFGEGREVSRRIAAQDRRARLLAVAEGLSVAGGLTLRTAAATQSDAAVADEVRALALEAEALRAAVRTATNLGRLWPAPPGVVRALRDHADVARVAVSSGGVLAWCREITAPAPWTHAIAWNVAREGHGLFEAMGVEAAIERAVAPRIALEGGVELAFAPGPALTAIDVDSARASRRTALDCNLAAARAIPAEIRLRGTAGLIVVDFIGLDGDNPRKQVMAELRRGFARDRRVQACHGLSPLGLAEIARRRGGVALPAAMLEPCPHGAGGWWVSAAALADDVARRIAREAVRPGGMTVICAAEVARALADPQRGGLAALEGLAGGRVTIRATTAGSRDHIDVARNVA